MTYFEELCADGMFEKLGYEKKESEIEVIYRQNTDVILIDKLIRNMAVYYNDRQITPKSFNIYELQAINKKCVELGWIKERD